MQLYRKNAICKSKKISLKWPGNTSIKICIKIYRKTFGFKNMFDICFLDAKSHQIAYKFNMSKIILSGESFILKHMKMQSEGSHKQRYKTKMKRLSLPDT
jgi:hypothetical protein